MIYRYVSFRLAPEVAEDVVGETFLIAFRRRGAYDLAYGDGLQESVCLPGTRRTEWASATHWTSHFQHGQWGRSPCP
ncbi:hypothetical protein AB0B45_43695 [Nonomuraea sp. NPDC049152]|uniref:hypothetical protein n=1 Tax=Nonomuraea sp. NPDC049152 TaxID=3154350 RepID=UPI0033F37C25